VVKIWRKSGNLSEDVSTCVVIRHWIFPP